MKAKKGRLDTRFVKQHLRTSIFKSYILYAQKFHPEVDIEEICVKAGLPYEYVVFEDNWVSVEYEMNFMKLLKEKISEPDFIRKVGIFGATPDVIGVALYFFMAKLINVKNIFQRLPFLTSLINKVMKLELLEMDSGEATFRLSPLYDGLSKYEQGILKERIPEFADNTIGYFHQIPVQKGLPAPKIESYKEGDSFVLKVKFAIELETLQRWSDIILIFTLPFVTAIVLFFLNFNLGYAMNAIVMLIATLLAMSISLIRKINQSVLAANNAAESLKKMDQQVETLLAAETKLARKLSESDAVTEVVKTLASADSEENILDSTCRALGESLGFDRSLILLASDDNSKLQFRSGYGLGDEFHSQLEMFELDIDIDSSDPTKISNVHRLGFSILIDDVEEHLNTLVDNASRIFLLKSRANSFAAVPIRTVYQSHGVLIADCFQQGKTVTNEDLKVLENIGKQVAVALEKIYGRKKLQEALAETRKLSESYSRFVPFETLKQMEYDSIYNVSIGDNMNKIFAVLFNDIRNFSTFTETMSPKDVLAFLNSYFGHLSPFIRKNNGIIDKFIGDCLMAIFPNPVDAIKASIDIQRELMRYNIDRMQGGREAIFSGIGVCYGNVVMGPVGFDGRLEITVLSDAVNTASRLDGLCKELEAKILVSGVGPEIITSTDPSVMTLDHGPYKVKGKNQSVNVIEIVDPLLLDEFEGVQFGDSIESFKEESIGAIERKILALKKKSA